MNTYNLFSKNVLFYMQPISDKKESWKSEKHPVYYYNWHPLSCVLQATQWIYKLLFTYATRSHTKKNGNQQFVFKHRSSNSHFVRKTMSRKAYVRMRCKPITEQWHNFCVQMTLANTFRTKKNSCETKYKKQQLKLFIGATTWSTNVSVPITTKTFHWFQNHFEMINLTQLQFEVLKAFV